MMMAIPAPHSEPGNRIGVPDDVEAAVLGQDEVPAHRPEEQRRRQEQRVVGEDVTERAEKLKCGLTPEIPVGIVEA